MGENLTYVLIILFLFLNVFFYKNKKLEYSVALHIHSLLYVKLSRPLEIGMEIIWF